MRNPRTLFVNISLVSGLLSGCLLVSSLAPLLAQDAPAPTERGSGRREQSPAQRLERLNRQVPDLSAAQKTQILNLYAAANDAMAAIRADGNLSPEQRNTQLRKVLEDSSARVYGVLTEAQQAQLKAARNAGREGGRDESREGGPGAAPAPASNSTPRDSPNFRILWRYEMALPDLSAQQKEKIVATSTGARPLMEAARANAALSDEAREAEMERIQADVAAQTMQVFTEAQRAKWQAVLDAQRRKEQEQELNLRPGETLEQKQERVLKPYLDAVPDLKPEQKAALIPIAIGVNDVYEEVAGDDSRTAEQKRAVLRRIDAATAKKVAGVLTPTQYERWQKAGAVVAIAPVAPTTTAPKR